MSIKKPNAKSRTSLVEHEHVRGSIASASSTGIESVWDARFQYKRHRPSTSGGWLVERSRVTTS